MSEAEDYDPDEDLSDDELDEIWDRAEAVAIVTPNDAVVPQIVTAQNMLVFSPPTFSAAGSHERSSELVQG